MNEQTAHAHKLNGIIHIIHSMLSSRNGRNKIGLASEAVLIRFLILLVTITKAGKIGRWLLLSGDSNMCVIDAVLTECMHSIDFCICMHLYVDEIFGQAMQSQSFYFGFTYRFVRNTTSGCCFWSQLMFFLLCIRLEPVGFRWKCLVHETFIDQCFRRGGLSD